ncbi:hypothetical protein BD408DRAFT_443827 [Parasitella parasitica]|nr:hypothetical protein BD408DRAFT_443827 [Parasitella parasitica]
MTKINKQNNQQQAQIPRPLNCFLMYRLEKQKEIVAKCPTANHRDISKIIAKWWQEATEEEKKPFRERARIAKQEHNALYPDYKYAPKKKVTPKRIYIRRNKKQQFTSRAKENNMLMEMIYEDPSALKQLSANDTNAASGSTDSTASPQPEWAPIAAKSESEDICYRSTYSVSPPMSFASCSSPATTPFDSPHVSPYSDYSEFEASSPVSCSAVCYPSSTTTTVVAPSSYYAESISPFSVLDSPCINDSNAYGYNNYYQMGAVDYFHSEHSNVNYNNAPKPTQEFSWSEPCDAFVAEQHNVMQETYETPVKYINPALLQLM